MLTKNTRRKCLTGGIATIILFLGGFNTTPSQAAWPDTSAFNGARELSDSELGGMRGRFVSNAGVLYFGVTLHSQWRTSGGEVLTAQASLSADVSGSQPKVKFQPSITAVTHEEYQQQSVGNGIIRNNATGNSTGAQQVIQVAGDGNRINNRFEIEITDHRTGNLTLPGNGQTEMTTASGSKISIHNSGGRFGIAMEVPGQGLTSQEILRNQGLRQLAQVNSDLQQITNVTTLQVQIQRQSSANLSQLRSAIQSAREIRGFK